MRIFLFVWFCLSLPVHVYCQEYLEIRGEVVDSTTQEPLPFATINIENEHLGTVSDYNGNFSFSIPVILADKKVVFSFLGYHSVFLKIDTFRKEPYHIEMPASVVELKEVVVNPLTPQELIKRCVARIPENYPDTPFISNGFYNELLKENDSYLKFVEAFVSTYNFSYTDTTTSQTKILEGRTRNDIQELHFMKDRLEKEKKKAEKKAKKHNQTFNKEDYEAISLSFSDPNRILKADPVRDLDPFMIEENFDKFTFEYGPLTTLGGKKLISINFKQEKKIDHMLVHGTLYLDSYSDAMVGMDLNGEFYIPTLVKPVLFVLGIKLTNPKFHKVVQYREINNKWFLNKIHLDANIDATKKKWFSTNQHANFSIENTYAITEIITTKIQPFKKEDLITSAPLEKQLGPYNKAFWDNHDQRKYQKNLE